MAGNYTMAGVSGKAGHGQDMDTNSDKNSDTDSNISFVLLIRFGKFCIALALYCYFMFIDPCCVIGFWP